MRPQSNLLRVNDIVAELEKRLDSLERQAKKAEKYKKLKARDARDRAARGLAPLAGAARAEQKVLEAQLSQPRRDGAGERCERVQRAGDEVDRSAARALEADGAGARARSRTRCTRSRARCSSTRRTWRTGATDPRQPTARASRGAGRGRARWPRRQRELPSTLAERREAELAALAGAWQGRRGRARRCRRRSCAAPAALAARGQRAARAGARRAGRRRRRGSPTTRRNLADLARPRERAAERRRAGHAARLEVLRGRGGGSWSRARAEVLDRVRQSRQLALELAERRGDEEDALARTREAFAENEMQVICAARGAGRQAQPPALAGGDPAQLRGLRPRRARGDAARPAARRARRASSAWWRTCSRTSPRFEKAIEAALGRAAAARDGREPRAGVSSWSSYLKSRWPRGALVPARVRSWPSRRAAGACPRGSPACWRGRIDEVQRRGRRSGRWCELLLGDVVLVEDLDAAARAARGVAPGFTAVTLDGEVLRAGRRRHRRRARGPGGRRAAEEARDRRAPAERWPRLEERYNELAHPALRAAEADGPHRGRAQGAGEEPARGGAEPRRPRRRTCTRPARSWRSCASASAGWCATRTQLDESLARARPAKRRRRAARWRTARPSAPPARSGCAQLTDELEALQRSAEALGQELTGAPGQGGRRTPSAARRRSGALAESAAGADGAGRAAVTGAGGTRDEAAGAPARSCRGRIAADDGGPRRPAAASSPSGTSRARGRPQRRTPRRRRRCATDEASLRDELRTRLDERHPGARRRSRSRSASWRWSWSTWSRRCASGTRSTSARSCTSYHLPPPLDGRGGAAAQGPARRSSSGWARSTSPPSRSTPS